jgi:hypothetical protein
MPRLQAHRAQLHGSAYIEALAVMILFSTLLACAVGLGRVYAAKLLSVQRARQAAWLHTQLPCSGERDALWDTAEQAASALNRSDAQFLARAASPRSAQTASVVSVGRAQAGRTMPQTSTRFACNELPPSTAHALASTWSARLHSALGQVLP